jgi:hypothetical protein
MRIEDIMAQNSEKEKDKPKSIKGTGRRYEQVTVGSMAPE